MTDDEYVEPDKTRHINNVIEAPKSLTHEDYESYLKEHDIGSCPSCKNSIFEKMGKDKLDKIFELQKQLDRRIQAKNLNAFPDTQGGLLSGLCTAIIAEACELQRLTNWKWWKTPKVINVEEAKEEAVDILHFLVSTFIALGMTPQDILAEYERKNKINHQRQEQGY
jgi:dimeric dUTPase (all-alpha-NTP-PPase superfamily)